MLSKEENFKWSISRKACSSLVTLECYPFVIYLINNFFRYRFKVRILNPNNYYFLNISSISSSSQIIIVIKSSSFTLINTKFPPSYFPPAYYKIPTSTIIAKFNNIVLSTSEYCLYVTNEAKGNKERWKLTLNFPSNVELVLIVCLNSALTPLWTN